MIKKKRKFTEGRKSVHTVLKFFLAGAAILNLAFLFGFDYGLHGLPVPLPSPVAMEASAEDTNKSETEPMETSTIETKTVETEAPVSKEPAETNTPPTETPMDTKSEAALDYKGPSITISGQLPQISQDELDNLPELLTKAGILSTDDGYGKRISSPVKSTYKMTDIPGIFSVHLSVTNDLGHEATTDFDIRAALTAPVILLKQESVRIKKGASFDYLDYLAAAMDTDGTSLSRDIRIKGTVNTSTPGTYELIYLTTGKRGGQSAEAKLTVTVTE